METKEHLRLKQSREQNVPWKKWEPYLSERQWGTVREDYSDSGNAWDYFAHDHARSRAYRWGKTASPDFLTKSSAFALPSSSGMAKTRSSKNGPSG